METKKKWYQSLLVKLLLGIAVGIGIGLIANEGSMQVIGSLKNLLGQLINYCVPLIILAFITPAIVGLKENAGKMLTITLVLCYLSSIGAAFFSVFAGYAIIPGLNIAADAAGTRDMPELLFNLGINALGAYVHSCRLQYIEFFGKFYEDGGKPFRPLDMQTRYVSIQQASAE